MERSAISTPLPPAPPEELGFASERLARIDAFLQREIAADRIPGAVVAIARKGRLAYYRNFGFLDKAAGTPMPLDAIFHLASMTKVMAAVGGLILAERGMLPLHSRLEEYFPEFADMKVGALVDGRVTTERARPIRIHDLYRHTSGMTYGSRGTSPLHASWPQVSGSAAAEYTGGEFLAAIAKLPLLYQPGTRWEYGFSTDVLGLVIEKVAGCKLGEFLRTEIWDKLGMSETTFKVPAESRMRMARPLPLDPLTRKPQAIAILDTPVKFDCAGSCAFGTMGDYLRFGQMLVNGGELEGTRILSPKMVALMTSDHLGEDIENHVTDIEGYRDGYRFGLGVAVRLHDGMAAIPGTKGDYSWNGASGTGFAADPAEQLVAVFGTAAPGDIRKYYREQMSVLAYGAITR